MFFSLVSVKVFIFRVEGRTKLMDTKMTFHRCEIKFLISKRQKENLLARLADQIIPDEFGPTTIRNIYFDTPDFRLIRHSLQQPIYKEKLRIRSYRKVNPNETVYVEIKKKYDSVVNKRRLSTSESVAYHCFKDHLPLPYDYQIAQEIDYFRRYYGPLEPKVWIAYDRQAFYLKDDDDFRITFDENIIYRQKDLSLRSEVYGTRLLQEQECLMELKSSKAIPLYLCRLLNEEKITKTSFSKYGRAYQDLLQKKLKLGKEGETE